MQPMGFHHVAYRCVDSQRTVDFYKKVLNMDLLGTAAESVVPSTREPAPYMNVLLDAGDGDILAFFEVPDAPPMRLDPNTPSWIQHIAFKVADFDALLDVKRVVEAEGLEVVGPVDHAVFRSIYFFDPNGHRLEVAAWSGNPGDLRRLGEHSREMLGEWSRTKRPPRHAAWLHEREFGASRDRSGQGR